MLGQRLGSWPIVPEIDGTEAHVSSKGSHCVVTPSSVNTSVV